MTLQNMCSPGSHPHSDRPNWRPAETLAEYDANCREGLEVYSERRYAKLMGMTRIQLRRARGMAEIPEEMFDFICKEALAQGLKLSSKALAQVGIALRRGVNDLAQVDCCPHCRGVLRVRTLVSPKLTAIVNRWLGGQS